MSRIPTLLPYKIYYDTKLFPFRDIVSSMIDDENAGLENLHKVNKYDLLTREKDQSTIWHKRYYRKFTVNFLPLYLQFVKQIKKDFKIKRLVYQKIPTFRVQLGDGNVSVGEWHRDRAYNHGIDETNFWLPFVDTNSLNTLWSESREGREDFRAYEVDYGEILVFDGSNCQHGSKENHSGMTRVSVDFRLVPENLFKPSPSGSINTNSKFEIGEYFDVM
jgi:hypothetical protein